MTVAALYDIHGNLPALEAVLDEVAAAGVDALVVGGDVIPGPMPGPCVSALMKLGVPLHPLSGNGEREALSMMRGGDGPPVPPEVREAIQWSAESLSKEERTWVEGWPSSVTVDVSGLGAVHFCHATPESDTLIVTQRTDPVKLEDLFSVVPESTVVCGHTHMQFEISVGTQRVVNAGSVGMPFGEPGAYWLLIDSGGLELRRTEYDLAEAARRIRATEYPAAARFAAASVLSPPSESEMLDRFAGVG